MGLNDMKMNAKIKKYSKELNLWGTKFLLRFLPHILPIKKNKVLFLSDYREKLGGNLGIVYEYLKDKDYKCVFSLKKARSVKRSMLEKMKLIYFLVTSEYILLEDMVAITSYMNVRKGQELVQLWHGPGAFKKFAFSRITNNKKVAIHAGYKKYTKAIVSSEQIRWCYAEAFGIEVDKVKATGFPRTDIFFDKKYIEDVKTKFYKLYPQLKEKKLILFAPTYRGEKVSDFSYDYSQLDFKKLYEYYHDEYVFAIKWHPMHYSNILSGKRRPPDFSEYGDFILDFSTYRDINDLLIVCDLLITDYSSVIFDYVLLNKPIIYFVYDLETYINKRGLYYDFGEYLYGDVAKNCDELIEKISHCEMFPEKREKFISRFMEACDGHSTEKTWKYICNKE